MRRIVLALLLLAGIVTWRVATPRFYLGGIQVNEPDRGAWLEGLEAAGFNTVAVTAYAMQGDWDSDTLWFEPPDPGVVGEIRAARERGLHVVLILRVALDHAFERNKFLWHGMIVPRDEETLGAWFAAYSRFVTAWAVVAEEEDVDLLGIGSELNSMTSTIAVNTIPVLEEYWANESKTTRENRRVLEQADSVGSRHLAVRGFESYGDLESYLADRTAVHRAWARQVTWAESLDPLSRINARRARLDAHWRRLVSSVREVYEGELTYAANFDQYEHVGFWDVLDVIGINAYFPLRSSWDPDLGGEELYARLEAGWTGVLGRLEHFRETRNLELPVVFTELGYVARRHSTIEPWAAQGFSVLPRGTGDALVVWEEQPPDETERALAVRALFESERRLRSRMLEGILYWKLSTIPAHREIEPFVLILGEEPEDELLPELRRFTALQPVDPLRRWLTPRLASGR